MGRRHSREGDVIAPAAAATRLGQDVAALLIQQPVDLTRLSTSKPSKRPASSPAAVGSPSSSAGVTMASRSPGGVRGQNVHLLRPFSSRRRLVAPRGGFTEQVAGVRLLAGPDSRSSVQPCRPLALVLLRPVTTCASVLNPAARERTPRQPNDSLLLAGSQVERCALKGLAPRRMRPRTAPDGTHHPAAYAERPRASSQPSRQPRNSSAREARRPQAHPQRRACPARSCRDGGISPRLPPGPVNGGGIPRPPGENGFPPPGANGPPAPGPNGLVEVGAAGFRDRRLLAASRRAGCGGHP